MEEMENQNVNQIPAGPMSSEAEARARKCAADIDATLQKHSCFIDVEVVLTRAGMRPIFKVIAKSDIVLAKDMPNDPAEPN
jgi:hypothetical protein